jgi:regulatory protein
VALKPRRRRASGREPEPPTVSARAAALRLLGRRDYTVAELRSRLADRGYTPDQVDATVDRCLADRLLDDRRVAAGHIRTASRIKGRGRLRIERELLARGVDRALVSELVAELGGDDDAAAIARVIARKRLPARPTLADRRRIFQHLLRRGFPADAIAKALRARGADPDPDEA